jgi:hypothetical protein
MLVLKLYYPVFLLSIRVELIFSRQGYEFLHIVNDFPIIYFPLEDAIRSEFSLKWVF